MRSAVIRQGKVVVDDFPIPQPGPGQVLVRGLTCGICGSDLHYLQHGQRTQEIMPTPEEFGGPLDFSRDVFMGHEFAAEIVEAGPNTSAQPAGTVVTSYPAILTPDGVRPIAFSNLYPAGFSEYFLLSPDIFVTVPNGLSPDHAALAENLAVGLHAVARAQMNPGEAALVSGCGPVGLATIAALRMAGVQEIVAADLVPARRKIAMAIGASAVADPARESMSELWARRGSHGERPVLFEAVGVPGRLDAVLREAPARSRVIVVGLCMEPDVIAPAVGVLKELDVHFAIAYSFEEFAHAVRALAEGEADLSPMLTGSVALDGIADAFADLAAPDEHCKILVRPNGV